VQDNARGKFDMETPEKETLTAAWMADIEPLYHQSQMMEIWRRMQALPPVWEWRGCQSRIWAGRLASGLGSQRLGNVLHTRNYRRHAGDLGAATYYAHTLLGQYGPLKAREFLNGLQEPAAGERPEIAQYYFTMQAMVAAEFRDFEVASRYMKRAAEYPMERPWLEVMQSHLLEKQDRYEEALEVARSSLSSNPNYRPGILSTAHLLQVLDRDEDALALLRGAMERTQSSPIASALACLELDLGLEKEALATLDRVWELSPLADRYFRGWIERSRTTLACRQGDLEKAREFSARAVALAPRVDKYQRELDKRLAEADPLRRRRCLAVDFVRQHHKTCAPATLTALAGYWGVKVEHLELAEKICYDGTPSHSQRQWAEGEGFVTREFTVTWEVAVALIDRGVPFALSTMSVNSGHLQAVVGYDELRKCLLLRDPYHYYLSEAIVPDFLEIFEAFGPRGLVLLPRDEAHRLEGLDLPDSTFYDQLHGIHCALEEHQRERAGELFESLKGTAGNHWIICATGWALGAYDANPAATLQHVDRWLEQFPDNPRLLRIKLDLLEALATRGERLEYLNQLVAQHPREPLFQARLAAELQLDGRELPRAKQLIRSALKKNPTDPEMLKILADILWNEGRLEEAADIQRLATCAAQHNEYYAECYFYMLQHLRRTEEGLGFLRSRFAELGHLSGETAQTLFKCLANVCLVDEGFAVLEEALAKRPEDGALILFYADALARYGRVEKAGRLLETARGKVRHSHWLRVAAEVATYRADLVQALKYWQEVLEQEPLALDAHQHVVQFLAETQNRGEALAHLDRMCRRFPGHCGLLRLRAQNVTQEPFAVLEPALRELLAANPVDTLARCELVHCYSNAGRHDEAMAEAERVIALAPRHPGGYALRGDLLWQRGRKAEARADYEQALRLDVNSGYAMNKLVETAANEAERMAALDLIQAELVRQVVFEDALPAFRTAAHGLLPPEKVLARLQEALAARPDLWTAWSVVAHQLANMNQLEDALRYSEEACRKFPLIPRIWIGHGHILRLRGDTQEAIKAMEQALVINPRFGEAAFYLADLYAKKGDLAGARKVLERGTAYSPLDASLHAALGWTLWRMNEGEAAVEQAKMALRINPTLENAWELLQTIAANWNQPRLAVEVARELTQQRPGDPMAWVMLADCLAAWREEECLSAVEKAISLNPLLEVVHDAKARFLVMFNRCDQALAACLEGPLQPPPLRLRLRAAWIESQRGSLAKAIERVKEALAESPAHYGALSLLCQWHRESGETEQALAAAERMVQVAPHEPEPLKLVAELQHALNNPKAAVASLRRVLELDSRDEYVHQLLALLLTEIAEAGGDADEAQQNAKEAMRFVQQECARRSNDVMLCLEMRLLLLRGETDHALARFVKICRMTEVEGDWGLFNAMDKLMNCHQYTEGRRIVNEALSCFDDEKGPVSALPCNPHLGALDVFLRFLEGEYAIPRYVKRVPQESVFFKALLDRYLMSAADAHERAVIHSLPFPWFLPRQLRRLNESYHQVLSGEPALAVKYAAALAVCGEYEKLREWYIKARSQGLVDGELYFYGLCALLEARDWSKAKEVLAEGLSVRQRAGVRQYLLLVATLFELMDGNKEKARDLFGLLPFEKTCGNGQSLHGLIQTWLEWESCGQPGTWQATYQLVKRLDVALEGQCLLSQNRPNRRLIEEVLGRWVKTGAWPGLRLWRWWRQFRWGWFALPFVPFALPLLCFPRLELRRWMVRYYWYWRR